MNAGGIGERASLVASTPGEGSQTEESQCGSCRKNLITLFVSTIPSTTSLITGSIAANAFLKGCGGIASNVIHSLAITSVATGTFSFITSIFLCCCQPGGNPCLKGLGMTVGAVGVALGAVGTIRC